MNVRAKFRCTSVTSYEGGSSHRRYTFCAVGADHVPENQRFHKATPSGTLEIYVDNPAVSFEPGKSYYLDFSPAD
jgi:hypothetical protein